MIRALLKTVALLVVLSVLSGCSLWQKAEIPLEKPRATTLDIAVIAAETKRPIAVHFFALESDEKFKKLDYFELMKKLRRKRSLGVAAHSKKLLLPGEMEKRSIKVGKNVRYYAVVAGFKNVEENDNWRYIQEIVPESRNDITLLIGESEMRRVKK